MKLRLLSLPFLLATAFICQAQNGPTQPSVRLSWTQSVTPGVTSNCVYRGTAAGVYTLPALFCSTAPITSYLDTSVSRSQTYHYAVTAKINSTEGAYSSDLQTVIPQAPSAPALNTPVITKVMPENKPGTLSAEVIWSKR